MIFYAFRRRLGWVSCNLFLNKEYFFLLDWSYPLDVITDSNFAVTKVFELLMQFLLYFLLSLSLYQQRKSLLLFFLLQKFIWYSDLQRLMIWYKVSQFGIKLQTVLETLYIIVYSCVCVDNMYSDYSTNRLGLLLGEVVSPYYFHYKLTIVKWLVMLSISDKRIDCNPTYVCWWSGYFLKICLRVTQYA